MQASRTLRFLFATIALLGTTSVATAQKQKLDKVYSSEDWGYEIRPIKGWNSMPADQDDKFTVGRWKLDISELEKRGAYKEAAHGSYCELRIIRIASTVVTPSGGAEAPKQESVAVPSSLLKKLNPKTLDEWIEANFEGASKRWLREPLKKGRMEGDVMQFTSSASYVTIGAFEYMGVQWAVVYECFEEAFKKDWEDIYFKSLQTFKVTKNVDPDAAAAKRKDITKLSGDELREALHQSIAGSPGWYAIDTEHYVFLTNAEDRNFIKNLGRDLETVRKKVYVPNFPPRNKKVPLNPVRIFATQQEYHQFGGPNGSAGYFSPRKGELVLFHKGDNQSTSASERDCESVMYHEGFHQYIHYAVGDVSPHSWFNEGHGDYFAGIKVSGNRVGVDPFDWRVQYLKRYMTDLIPCRSLIRLPQSEYYTNAGLKYSQGWALIYYLREVSRDKSHAKILETYFSYLADNVEAFRSKEKKDGDEVGGESVPGIPGVRIVDFENQAKVEQILSEAVDKAFAGVDLEALDAELRKWIETL